MFLKQEVTVQNVLINESDDKIITPHHYQDGLERFELINEKYHFHKHSTLSEYRRKIVEKDYLKLYKIATIRNPWDRLISMYFSPSRQVTKWNRKEFIKIIEKTKTLSHYIRTPSKLEHLLIKCGIINSPLTRSLVHDIDFLIRFESLEDDFKKVCAKLDILYTFLPKRNKSTREPYSKYYDQELIELVRRKFSEEIKLGNYQF